MCGLQHANSRDRQSARSLRHGERNSPCRRGTELLCPARRDRGDRRRVRLGQIGLGSCRDAASAAEHGADRRRFGTLRGTRASRPRRRGNAPHSRARDLDDLSGAYDLAEPGAHHRAADHGTAHHASRDERGGGARARRRASHARWHHRPREPARAVSAPALRRHAAARHDRDWSRLQSQAAHCRRADHGARRDHPRISRGVWASPSSLSRTISGSWRATPIA